jgi:hypothetical protein
MSAGFAAKKGRVIIAVSLFENDIPSSLSAVVWTFLVPAPKL